MTSQRAAFLTGLLVAFNAMGQSKSPHSPSLMESREALRSAVAAMKKSEQQHECAFRFEQTRRAKLAMEKALAHLGDVADWLRRHERQCPRLSSQPTLSIGPCPAGQPDEYWAQKHFVAANNAFRRAETKWRSSKDDQECVFKLGGPWQSAAEAIAVAGERLSEAHANLLASLNECAEEENRKKSTAEK